MKTGCSHHAVRGRVRKLTAAFALWLFAELSLSAYLGPRPSLDQLIAEAEAIFFGEVADVRASWETHDAGRSIVSHVTVRVIHRLKGDLPTHVELQFLGGTIGDVTLSVSDVPQFQVGDRDVMFVHNDGRSISPLVGVAHGRFRVVKDIGRGDVVRTHAGDPIRGLTTVSVPGMSRLLVAPELSLREFEDEISRRIAAAPGRR